MSKSHTWGQFASEVLALYEPPMRRVATKRKMEHVLAEFEAICRCPAELTPSSVAAWIAAHPRRRPATVESYLRSLRAACTYAIGAGRLERSPFDFRSPARWVDWDVPELPPPVHSAEEIARVLALADQEALEGDWRASRLRAVVYAFAFTGARRRELLALAVADVHLDQGVIDIQTNGRRSLKTHASAARIPIPAPLAGVLATWLPLCGSSWLFPGLRRRGPWLEGPPGQKALDQVKALGLRAGVPGLTFQSFRHTFASLSEGWGIGELALQRVLRHSNLRTQQAYRHELPEVLKDAAAKVHFS
jgi:integrase